MLGITQYEPLWGVWRTEKLIGEGSFGKVYRAAREEFGQKFYSAIKHISIPANESQIDDAIAEGLATDEASVKAYFDEVTQNLITEILMMHELKGTTNIVSYEDHMVVPKPGGIGNDIFIRMELLTSLNAILAHRQFTSKDVIKLGIDICTALETCSKMGIIHRDIKPSNIFVNERGDYKLGDFGVARQLENTTSGMSKKGTYIYMAPEIYRGEAANLSADTFSLGIVMYRLLNGNRAPFLPVGDERITSSDNENALARRMSGEALPAPAFADKELAEIILIATSFDRTKRFASPTEFKEALQCVAAGNHYERTLLMMDTSGEKTSSSVLGGKTDIYATCAAFGSASKPNIVSEGTVVGATASKEKNKKKKVLPIIFTAAVIALAIGIGQVTGLYDITKLFGGKDGTATTTPNGGYYWDGYDENGYWTGGYVDPDVDEETDKSSEAATESTTTTTTTTTTTDKRTTTTDKRTTTTTTVSGWVEKSEVPAGANIVNTKTQYRYSDKLTKTSNESSLSGWTLESSTANYSSWSEQKESTSAITESETCKADGTKKVDAVYETASYTYTGYRSGSPGVKFHYCLTCAKKEYPNRSWSKISITLNNKITTTKGSWSCSHYSGTGTKYYYSSNGRYYYHVKENKEKVSDAYTIYYYRTRTITSYTYTYSKWSDPSSWSDTKYTESDTRKVETRTLYKYTTG